MLVTATSVVPDRAVSPYALGILAETLRTKPVLDPDTGQLRLTMRIPGTFGESTAVELALSLARATLYTAGLRGWTATATRV